MSMQTLSIRSALGMMLLGALVACGSSKEPESGQAAPVNKSRPAANAQPDMVAAVSAGREEGPVELRFELSKRPQVNEPIDINFSLVPRSSLKQVFATFQAGEGLELRQGAQMARVDRPATGTPLMHTVTVVPLREGIFTVSAVVLSDSSEQSLARTYSVPLIVGSGMKPPGEAGL